jgi:hypothetical protein
LSHSIQHVHFRPLDGGAPLGPGPTAELERLTAALAERLAQDPLELQDVRWSDRPQRYSEWLESALDALTAQDPNVAGGWTLDFTAEPSITSPDGDRWLRINGASFALTHSDATVTGETFVSIIDDAALGAGARTVELAVQNETVDEAQGAVLFLDSRRARIHAVRPTDPSSMRIGDRDPRSADAWVAEFPYPLLRGDRSTFEVDFEGELPYVRSVLWVADDGAEALDPGARFDNTPRSITPTALAALETLGRTHAEEYEHREALIQASPMGDRRVFQEFFLDLDREPSPGTTEARLVRQLTSYLGQRVLVRAEEAGFGETPVFDATDVASWRADVVLVAARIEALALAHFPELLGDDTARFEAAVEQFATGALRLFDTHGVPNGVSYFSFCELAIMMVEYGVRTQIWRPLIPLLARTSELYTNAYHRCDGPRTIAAYGVANNLDGSRTQGPTELAANRAAWALVIDPVYSFGRIVNAALRDEVVAGPVTPFALEDFGCGGGSVAEADLEAVLLEGARDRNWRGGPPSLTSA